MGVPTRWQVGAAWGGRLSNFAAGAFILVLRRFKVSDYVIAGDVEGTVRMIGLFNTTIDTSDNVQTMVGNAKVMAGTIRNFSHDRYRRVDLMAPLDHSVEPADASRRLREALPKIPNVVAEFKPDVEILTFNERGKVLAVRPYCSTAHYWQVYSDSNRSIRETFGTVGYPAAEAHLHIRHMGAQRTGVTSGAGGQACAAGIPGTKPPPAFAYRHRPRHLDTATELLPRFGAIRPDVLSRRRMKGVPVR